MKHATIIAHLCQSLEQGQGINSALAEINLTTDYLADHLSTKDRVRLHQAYSVYLERLDKDLTERARLGRPIGALSHALRLARENPLILPGDEDQIVEAPRPSQGPRREITKSPLTKTARPMPKAKQASVSPPSWDDLYDPLPEDDDEDDGYVLPPSPTQQPFSPPNPTPAPETVEKPIRERLRAEETPSSPPEPPPEPPKPPELRWRRLFTGRAVAQDAETGKIIKSLMPGERGYAELEFENHE